MNVTVDRVEGAWAVLGGDGGSAEVPLAWLPAGVKEGSVLDVTFTLDASAEARMRAEVAAAQARLAAGDPGDDDIEL